WSAESRGLRGTGRLDGSLRVRRGEGRWQSSGEVTIGALEVAGPRLAGDRLTAGRVGGVWDLEGTASGWGVRRLDLVAPFAPLRAQGQAVGAPESALGTSRLEGRVDLAALARQVPHALRLREGVTLERGTAELLAETKQDQAGPLVKVSA